ncbi:MAG: AAA family ATPase [Methylocella sp.]
MMESTQDPSPMNVAPVGYEDWTQERKNAWWASSTGNSGVAAQSVPRFRLVPFEKIAIDTTPTYLIKGLVPRVGLTVVWGPPKCGKSFFVFDLVMHVALGWEYRGRRVRQGHVVYCALEGADGFRARVEAFRVSRLAETSIEVPFHLMASPMTLVADHAALVASIRGTLGAAGPGVVVIDTLNRSLLGSESDDRDMAAYVKAADAIRDAFKCSVIIVHHCGHDASRPRGHGSLMGAVDAQISVKRDATDNIVASVDLMKDGAQGDEIASRLEVVEVGFDEDGEAITSCVIAAVEGLEPSRKKTRPKCTKGASIALVALQKAIGEVGEIPPASNHIPTGVKCVTTDQWREYAYRHGVSGSDEPRARRQAFQRAHEALVADRHVAVWEPFAWPTS